jgi:asparagine synthase (glutamine-hydrolysing)
VCGICGIVQVAGPARPVIAPEVLDRMVDVMDHRGPDDRGTHQAPGVALGARRLSIVDVEGGHQPLCDERGRVWAALNGEIYNQADLRDELLRGGHRLRSRCDTEVLPHLYEEEGPALAARLRGIFGLAVWDAERRRAVLVRDPLGVKPLYWARVGDLVIFASELKSVLASGLVPEDLDYEAIDAYLTLGFVPGPRTPLAAVAKLRPGHRLLIGADGVREEAYWEYPLAAPVAGSPEEHAERLLADLDEAVRLQLMSDVPLGAMLSGGLDSSLIVALMARHASGPVRTFSVAFAEAGADNELEDARLVARRWGTEHHEITLSVAEAAVDVETLAWHLDEPNANMSGAGFFRLSELAAGRVRVALCGQGADELLAGYRTHRAAALMAAADRLPGSLRARADRLPGWAPAMVRRTGRALAAPDVAGRLVAMASSLDGPLRRELAREPLARCDGGEARRAALAAVQPEPASPLAAALRLDARLALVDDLLHYFDRLSMAHSLEVRVPFLDPRVVERCAQVPDGLKLRGLRGKRVLRLAARGLVPERVLRKRKIGFLTSSVDRWVRANLDGTVSDYLLDPAARCGEFLDRARVARLVREPDGGGLRRSRLLLTILMLEVWLSSFLPRALAGDRASPTAAAA